MVVLPVPENDLVPDGAPGGVKVKSKVHGYVGSTPDTDLVSDRLAGAAMLVNVHDTVSPGPTEIVALRAPRSVVVAWLLQLIESRVQPGVVPSTTG